jgi:hypothetical protein
VVMARIPAGEQVVDSLNRLTVKSEILPIELLERVRTILPTDEEVSCFNQFNPAEVSKLRDIERKIFDLFRLPRLAFRIRFCLIALQLPILISDVRREIGVVRACAEEVKESRKLKKLLHLVLQMGNYMNFGGSGNSGGIRGFSIDSLGKLMEFKSVSDPSVTTLHFLAARIITSEPELIDVYSELPSLKPATRIATESIVQTIHGVKKDPESIRVEITTYKNSYSPESIEAMTSFLGLIESDVESITASWTACESELVDVRKFFGEDPKRISPDDFFNHLRTFLDNLTHTCADLKKRHKKFEKIMAALSRPPTEPVPTPDT